MTIPRNLSFLAEGASSTGVLGTANGGTGLNTLGTAGQALVVNSGATGLTYSTPSAGAMSLISTQTGSSVASLAWTGLSTYNTYLLIFELYVSSGQQIQLNTGTGSTPTYSTSGYKQNALAVNSASTTITNATNGAGYLLPAVGGIYFSGAPIASGYVYITNATSNNFINSAMYFLNTTPLRIYETSGGQTNDNAFTAIKLTSTSGNISGTASLYGISS